jgi:MFS transporter, SP family, general alpha glucoside:H+ symporter
MSKSRDVVRLDSGVIQKVSMVTGSDDIAAQTADAKAATEREHSMTLRETLKLYPKAVLFAFVFSSAIIMEGYDTWLMGSFYGFKP